MVHEISDKSYEQQFENFATIEIPLSSNPKRWIKIIPNNAPHSSPDQILLNRFFSPPSRENQRVTHTQKSDPRWSLKWLGTPGCRTQTCVIGEWSRYFKKPRPKSRKRILTNGEVFLGWVGALRPAEPAFFTRARRAVEQMSASVVTLERRATDMRGCACRSPSDVNSCDSK